MKVWVAGFGNEYREDDGAGVVLAGRVAAFLRDCPETEVELCMAHQLLPELAEELAGMDWAIFCDADTARHEGGFSIRELEPVARLDGFNIHSMGPAWLLALAKQVGTSPCRSLLVTISGESFDFSDRLTDVCAKRIDVAEAAFRRFWNDSVFDPFLK